MIDRQQLNHGALPPPVRYIDALLVLAEQDDRDASDVPRAGVSAWSLGVVRWGPRLALSTTPRFANRSPRPPERWRPRLSSSRCISVIHSAAPAATFHRMRFIANGPEIPDELVAARDAGKVIFFCGAGVSQAQAGLPNFSSLAGRVLSSLGSALDSPARRLFAASQTFEAQTGLTGVVATDRIFGLLEREFYPEEVRQAVAAALRPSGECGLGAHRMLLDLSRHPGGIVRLVTTNFDRLFEECDPAIGSFNPPHLPDPRRAKDFRGIMHIHGRVDPDYQDACDEEFVLSSTDFGRAYLSDGWATRYIQALLERYEIVFVGYSADDPPVQYLLEALSRSGDRRGGLYAFQAGNVDQAEAQWAHKGVVPIAYEGEAAHAALWQTLSAWADRSRASDAWHQSLLTRAASGPRELSPHERGVMAHLAATADGARRFSAATPSMSAEWLCVLDAHRRYAPPGPLDPYEENSERFDPFAAYGLDCDQPPPPVDPEERFARRETPGGAWDLLAPAQIDGVRSPGDAIGRFRGVEASLPSRLPPRLWHLGTYLTRAAHEPASVWWASHQASLHPDIVNRLEWSLRREPDRFPPAVRRAWRLLLAAWRERRPDAGRCYEIEALVAQSGWSTELVRETVAMYRPFLTVQPPLGTFAPADVADVPLDKLIRPDVEYPRPHERLDIPPQYLAYAVSLLRAHIEHAIVLEREISGRDYIYFDVTRSDEHEESDENGFQLNGLIATFVNRLARLAEVDHATAKAEFDRWPVNVHPVFTRLRLWAAGRPTLLAPDQAAAVFLSLDDHAFWTDQQEADLLRALRDRWTDLPANARRQLEQRLLTGGFPWEEPRDDLERVTAHHRLNRLQWLGAQGVEFEFDLEDAIARNRIAAPEWEPRFADGVAEPKVGPVRTVETDTNPASLIGLPISKVLAVARGAEGRDFETFIDHRPFRGLAEQRPAFALAVLTHAARAGDRAEREWTALLYATSSGTLPSRLLRAIGAQVARLPLDQVAALRHPVSEWMRDRATTLLSAEPATFMAVWDRLVSALASHPPKDRFRRPDEGWVDGGLNQPAGRLVDALFKDAAKAAFTPQDGLPLVWRTRLEQLLSLPGDARRHAIAMISPHLNWLYYLDSNWTEARLLSVADKSDEDSRAFWGGYFWAARTPQLPLYTRLKPAFLALARISDSRRDHAQRLAGMLLAGWAGSNDPDIADALIPDIELREVLIHSDDNLRTQMLWHLERWSMEPGSDWGKRIIPFFTQVWPRQRSIRTPRTTGRLVDFALAQSDRFVDVVQLLLPLLGPVAGASVRMSAFLDPDDGNATKHPAEMLDVLWRILPEDPSTWPYETRRMLEALEQQVRVQDDPRLAELLRRDRMR